MSLARAACFDLDGTLLRDDHVDGVVREVAARLAERYGIDPSALADANERVWWECWPEMGEAWLRGELAPESVPTEVWRRALAEVGVADAAAAVEAHALQTATEETAFRLYEESAEVLARLRERGIPLALITNGPSGLQRAKLRAVGIEDAFDVVIVSGEHGVHKPDGEIFDLALDGLGVTAAEALHVGDNLVADIAGARDAGLTAVWIDRGTVGAAGAGWPATVVANLRELYELLGAG
ncbi:HAD family hydrolase [Microbacterium sulfonylureivorans]|uniref:HAD family hydrolase n=1 Tax=Microbacterium sulfonylureivorans TaxID=2486854 RepID=UPI000FD6DF88|nr:HAD family hydrolase [Microbacterium sulfonylureivorans]